MHSTTTLLNIKIYQRANVINEYDAQEALLCITLTAQRQITQLQLNVGSLTNWIEWT
jgi:hypothetical protein